MTLPNFNVRPNPSVMGQPLEVSYLLFHLETDDFYETNRTLHQFWELLHKGYTTSQIYEQLLNDYEVEPERLAREIHDILETLIREQLVIVDDAS